MRVCEGEVIAAGLAGVELIEFRVYGPALIANNEGIHYDVFVFPQYRSTARADQLACASTYGLATATCWMLDIFANC